MMKRVLPLILALLLALTMIACGDKDDGTTDDPVINIGGAELTYKADNGDVFTYEYLSSTEVTIVGFNGKDEPHTVTIPKTVSVALKDGGTKEYAVTEIAAEAFKNYSNISEIKCEAELVQVGDYAFADCVALAAVTLPDTVTSVGRGAFYKCSALATLNLGQGLSAIGDHAFYETALTAVTFPASLRSIGALAFGHCTALTAIELPEGVTTVGDQSFYECTAVEKLVLPASLEEIGEWAFNPIARDLPDEAITVPAGSVAEEHIKQFR